MNGVPGCLHAHSRDLRIRSITWQRGSRVANQLRLKWRDDFGLPGWAQCSLKGP